jgi:hypothetical protein
MAFRYSGDPYFSTNLFLNMMNFLDELEPAPAQASAIRQCSRLHQQRRTLQAAAE